MKLELTDHECDVLLDLLESAHRVRILEQHRTDALQYKGMLQEKVQIIEDLMEKLARQRVTVAAPKA